jgi:MFS family permease
VSTPAPRAGTQIAVGQFRLLARRRFLPMFLTQLLGAFNDNVYKNALVILITFRAATADGRESAMLVTLSAGVFILPFFLFSGIAGQLADKHEKTRLIRAVKIAEVAIMALGALAFLAGSVSALMAILFLMGSQSALFGPLKYGILPQHLDERELTGGNGMFQMATYLAILVGTIAGGLLVSAEPHGPRLVAAAVVLLALLGYGTSLAIPVAPATDPGLALRFDLHAQTVGALAWAREDSTVFTAVVGISWFWFLGATYLQLLPTYARDALGGGPQVVTFLLAAFSVGIGIGSLLCERLSRGRIELALVPIGAAGLTLFSLGPLLLGTGGVPAGGLGAADFLSRSANLPVVASFLGIALSGGLYIVPLYALVQSRSAPARRARVIAANNILNALFMVASAILTLILLALGLGIPAIFAVVGVLNVAVALWCFGRVPEFLARVRVRAGLRTAPPP